MGRVSKTCLRQKKKNPKNKCKASKLDIKLMRFRQ